MSRKPIMLLLLLLLPIFARAESPDIAAQVKQAARNAEATYEATGVAGLVAESQDCYKKRKFDFYCINFDVAAGALDRRFANSLGVRRYEYFDVAQFLKRARPLFARARWSMETSNKYLQFVDGAMQDEINVVSMEANNSLKSRPLREL